MPIGGAGAGMPFLLFLEARVLGQPPSVVSQLGLSVDADEASVALLSEFFVSLRNQAGNKAIPRATLLVIDERILYGVLVFQSFVGVSL